MSELDELLRPVSLLAEAQTSWRCDACDQTWAAGELESQLSIACDVCGAPCGWCGGEGGIGGAACMVCGAIGGPPFGDDDHDDIDPAELGGEG